MKVLYIGHYRDNTGWGQHAINNILALDAAGVDVVPRAIRFNQANEPLPPRILELEGKDASGCTHVIQQTLPHFLSYQAGWKNIAYLSLETSSIRRIGWAKHLNLMDEVWVPCLHNKDVCENDGVRIPISVVPAPVDTSKFENKYPLWEPLKPLVEGKFVFYYVGEMTARKDMVTLLRAFHTEFSSHEPVELVLKINGDQKQLDDTLRQVRMGLKLRPEDKYKKEIIIRNRLPEDIINGIHQNLDCFVTTSKGEAVGLPILDAQGFGSLVVAPRHSGIADYLASDVGFEVEYIESPCYGGIDTLEDLYTAEENWYSCSVLSVMQQMRAAYTVGKLDKEERIRRGREDVAQLSLANMGELMKRILHGK